MMKKILKFLTMGVLILLLCGQIFILHSLVKQTFTWGNFNTGLIIGCVFSVMIMLIALIKNKERKVFILGFWPILSVLFFILLSFLSVKKSIIPPEILYVFLIYVGLLFQVFILNKKVGYFGCGILLLSVVFYIQIAPIYLCERENDMIKCPYKWDKDKKICQPCIQIEENK